VRNVLGFRDADHAETRPDASRLVITALACSLVGQHQSVRLVDQTRAAALYGVALPEHPFFVATLFLPQARSTRAHPRPLLQGYAAALGGRC
jgi:CTP synthase (UTP-ammonia lyase)